MTPIREAFAGRGPHERQIRALFPGNFVWPGGQPIYAQPLYILGFTNRSGSNLLADYLRQTGKFRGFGEGLNWDEIQRSTEQNRVSSFPDYIARLAGPPDRPGLWGVKASWSQIILLKRANILAMFPSVRVIHSVRQDLLGQAVSHWIAHQTNRWTSVQKASDVIPEFAADRIEQILMDIVRSNSYIDLISQTLGIPRQVLVYEQLQADPAGEVGRLADALSVDLGDWQPGTPRISRQRDGTNDSFQQRCMEAWRAAIAS